MRWHRLLTTTRQMKNQASDMAGYLLFTVPTTMKKRRKGEYDERTV